MLRGVRGVVFDVDDTLYLERDYVRSGFRAVDRWVRDNLGFDGFFQTAWRLFEGGHRGKIFDEALAAIACVADATTIAAMVTTYREHKPVINLLPDARRCLDRLQGHRMAMSVLSDGPLNSQEAKVLALRLRAWCDPVILTARYGAGYGKPHTRGFGEIARRLCLSGGELVYVADNPAKDFDGPRRLGWSTVRVRRERSLHAHESNRVPVSAEVFSLDSLSEMLA